MEREDRCLSSETRQVLFWALLAARCAGETIVSRNRVWIALLQSTSVADYCTRVGIASKDIIQATEDPQALPFAECARRIENDLSQKSLTLGAKNHIASVRPMPLEGTVQSVIRFLMEPHDAQREIVTPLEFLSAMMRADPALEAYLARHGLDAESLNASLDDH